MKSDLLPRQLLLVMALTGLMIGCGGDKDTKKQSDGGSSAQEGGGSGDQEAGSSGTQGGGDEKVTLAEFLPGKRLYIEVDAPVPPEPEFEEGPDTKGSSEPPEDRGEDAGEDPSEEKGETPIFAAGGAPPQKVFKAQFVMQFEKDGKCYAGMIVGGKIMGFDEDDGTTYKVSGPKKVTIYKDGKVNGGITFPTAHPKKGDKIKFDERDGQSEATITKIEDASPIESGLGSGSEDVPELDDPSGEFGPGGPAPEGFGGGPAFGIGPNGEFSKSKHPAFIAHTWKTGPFSKGVKQTATFDKTGALTITPEKSKPIKGTWAVEGAQITLTYPNPETGKEQALKYRFLFGGSELIGEDGKATEKVENLYLKGVGDNKTSIAYERTLGP